MSQDPDPIGPLRALAASSRERELQLKAALVDLGHQIADVCRDRGIRPWSKRVQLEQFGDEEWVYGHLCVREKGLEVLHRTTEDDFDDHYNQVPEDLQTFDVKRVEDCPVGWVAALAGQDCLQSLIDAVAKHLKAQADLLAERVESVNRVQRQPIDAQSSAIRVGAGALGYDRVLACWQRAHDRIESSPAEAITHAYSLVETVAKHVLDDFAGERPSNETVAGLWKFASARVELSPDQHAGGHLRKLTGGLATIVDAISSLRDDYSDSHGKDAAAVDLAPRHARLAVSAAGAASCFLMDTIRDRGTSSKGSG